MNFIKTNSRKKQSNYWSECVTREEPYIVAERRGRRYTVFIDLFMTPHDLSNSGREQIRKESQIETEFGGFIHYIGNTSSRIINILPERVDSFCSKLAQIVRKSESIQDVIPH